MQVLEQVEVKLEWSDLDNLTYHTRNEERRVYEKVHVSDVLRSVAIRHGQYTNEDREDEMPLRILLGLAFEESAARLYEDMWWQPGQVEVDGVVGSPDGVTFPKVMAVDEFKYTGKSMRKKGAKTQADGTVAAEDLKDIRGEWIWMQQGMSYVNLLRRISQLCKDLCSCRFHICWKYGWYTHPFTEVYMRYLVRFSEAELRGNWALLQSNKKLEVLR